MQKRTINAGDPVFPEMINALQDLSFDKNQDEVGHLPLPPDYNDKQQWKTFDVTGDNQTCNLGDWVKNAVVRAHASYDGTNTVFPENVNVESSEMDGIIVFVPYLTTGKTCAVSYKANGRSVSSILVPGEIAVLYTETFDFCVPQIKKILSTEKCNVEQLEVSTKILFDLGNNRSVILQASFNNNTKILSLDSQKFDVNGTVKASSFVVGDSSSGQVQITNNGNNASIAIKAQGTYNYEHLSYNTATGGLSIGHSYENDIESVDISKGTGSFAVRTGEYSASYILLNKDVSDSLSIVSSPGKITIYTIQPPSGQSSISDIKTVISSQGVMGFNHIGGAWVYVS